MENRENELATLSDLKKFLVDEFGDGQASTDLDRAFMPLTDGLGIHHTPKPQGQGASKAGAPHYIPTLAEAVTEYRAVRPPEPQTRRIEETLFETPPAEEVHATEEIAIEPPPVPVPKLSRRLLAGFVDQVFVFLAWGLALAITSNALSGTPAQLVRSLSSPVFLQSALLEFAIIWLGYLALSFGFLEMTFGMWVWGLRIGYGGEGRFWKKVARVVMGMIFYPLVVPCVLLLIRRDGDTLIDTLSQSHVYGVGPA